jgi:hypothetical protein
MTVLGSRVVAAIVYQSQSIPGKFEADQVRDKS